MRLFSDVFDLDRPVAAAKWDFILSEEFWIHDEFYFLRLLDDDIVELMTDLCDLQKLFVVEIFKDFNENMLGNVVNWDWSCENNDF